MRAMAFAVFSVTVAMLMRIGVHDRPGIPRDRDMAFPEQKVAALQGRVLPKIEQPSKRSLLHIAVARRCDAGGGER